MLLQLEVKYFQTLVFERVKFCFFTSRTNNIQRVLGTIFLYLFFFYSVMGKKTYNDSHLKLRFRVISPKRSYNVTQIQEVIHVIVACEVLSCPHNFKLLCQRTVKVDHRGFVAIFGKHQTYKVKKDSECLETDSSDVFFL